MITRKPVNSSASPLKPLLVSASLMLMMGLGLRTLMRSPEGKPPPQPKTPMTESTNVERSAEYQRGYELSQKVCQSCHLYPDPPLLDKTTWAMETLPAMGIRLGIGEANHADYLGGDRLKAAKIFPAAPTLDIEEWRAIWSYYLTAAPSQALSQGPRAPIQKGLPQFTVMTPPFRQPAATTLVKIDESTRTVYVGDADTKKLGQFTPEGKLLGEMSLDSPPVSLEIRTNGLVLALIGRLTPSDELLGKVVVLESPKAGVLRSTDILKDLPRTAHVAFADLNHDGREDIIVSGYGNFLGHFSWFENLGSGHYTEHILIDRAGAIRSYARDFNGDGHPDIMVMMAAAKEGIYLLLNDGKGEFTTVPVVEQNPAWGYSYFELADFNHDGYPDILATNGDNGDYIRSVPPLKNYHGVRIYLNDGKNHFREAFFYPLNGAYKAMARDFRGNGQLDIAAISFFPDYRNSPMESFVYLENQAGFEFKAFSFPESVNGAWMTMDVGDLDGDGDLDIVLGAYNHGPNYIPHQLFELWKKRGPAFLVLKNKLK